MIAGFVGDVVGSPGREILISNANAFKVRFGLDFLIANCENASGGFGLSAKNAVQILQSGVDLITGGNHSFDKKDIIPLMQEMPIIRPFNQYDCVSGKGIYELKNKNCDLSVINLIGHYSLGLSNNAFWCAKEALKICQSKNILIDFHAEATSEKRALMCYLRGQVSAIFGTHTHVGSDDLQIDENTAYVSDVGLSGSYFNVIGFDETAPINAFLSGLKHAFNIDKTAPRALQMVVFQTDENGKAVDAFKVKLIDKIDDIIITKAIYAKR